MTDSIFETAVALPSGSATASAVSPGSNAPSWAYYLDMLVARPLNEHYAIHARLLERVHTHIKRGSVLAVSYPDIEHRAFFFGPTLRVFARTEAELQLLVNSMGNDPLPNVAAGGVLIRKPRKTPSTDELVQFYRFRRKPGMEHIKNHSLPIISQSTEKMFRFEIKWRERSGNPAGFEQRGGSNYGLGYWLPSF